MGSIAVPGDPKQYELERIRLEHAWLEQLEAEPELQQKAKDVYRAAFAESTWRTYEYNWRLWVRFALERGWPFLPSVPAAVAFYIVFLGGVNKLATIVQKVIAIAVGHRFAKAPDPTKHFDVKDSLKGVARIWGAAQRGKDALSIDDVRKVQEAFRNHANPLEACRDLTILKAGVAAGQRGGQLSGFDVEHMQLRPQGFRVEIPRSKTDPYGEGARVWLPYGLREETCPVRQLLDWFDDSGITIGPVFRHVTSRGRVSEARLSRDGISDVIKRCMAIIGRDPADFGSHSLRVSFVSLAHEGGASDEVIMDQTGHRNRDSVRRYLRFPDYPEANTSALVGL